MHWAKRHVNMEQTTLHTDEAALHASGEEGAAVGHAPQAEGERAQGEHAAEGHAHPEIPNIVTLLRASPWGESPTVKLLHHWETPLFSLLAVAIVAAVAAKALSRPSLIPGRLQNAAEMLVEGLSDFFSDILGEKYGKRFAFYAAGLFIFILCNNLLGMVPFCKAPTSVYNTTLALAICTFCYVQYIGIRENGIWGYFHHLLGSPRDVVGWCMVPLMFPLHLIEEIAKPVSLSLRLFGNILGEDILLAVFLALGIMLVSFLGLPAWAPGLPLQLPLFFLALLLSTIQALVFSLLSCIYIFMVLPHEEHHKKEEHEAVGVQPENADEQPAAHS